MALDLTMSRLALSIVATTSTGEVDQRLGFTSLAAQAIIFLLIYCPLHGRLSLKQCSLQY
jgi:hypothetical protein